MQSQSHYIQPPTAPNGSQSYFSQSLISVHICATVTTHSPPRPRLHCVSSAVAWRQLLCGAVTGDGVTQQPRTTHEPRLTSCSLLQQLRITSHLTSLDMATWHLGGSLHSAVHTQAAYSRLLPGQVHVVCPVSEPCWVFDNLYKIFVHYNTSLSTAKRHSMFPLIKTSGMSVYLFTCTIITVRSEDLMYVWCDVLSLPSLRSAEADRHIQLLWNWILKQ